MLRNAIRIALEFHPNVENYSAGSWLRKQLDIPSPGIVTVIFHSVVWMYIPDPEWASITELLHDVGRRATQNSPIAWLRLEARNPDYTELRLTI